jgi:hypothetical protein
MSGKESASGHHARRFGVNDRQLYQSRLIRLARFQGFACVSRVRPARPAISPATAKYSEKQISAWAMPDGGHGRTLFTKTRHGSGHLNPK